jgi:hypothetical protein
MTKRAWMFLFGFVCAGAVTAAAQTPLRGCFFPNANQCEDVCSADNDCRRPCRICNCDDYGNCQTEFSTCGEQPDFKNWCHGDAIGYGGFGELRFHDYCANGLVPMNVIPYPPYPRANDGDFSCWGNTPDVLCPTKPPIEGYVNIRQCYVAPDGSKTDYGCDDCCNMH